MLSFSVDGNCSRVKQEITVFPKSKTAERIMVTRQFFCQVITVLKKEGNVLRDISIDGRVRTRRHVRTYGGPT